MDFDFEFVGLPDCSKLIIEYTDPLLSRLNRLLVHQRDNPGQDVRITAKLIEGIKPGDVACFYSRVYNVLSVDNANSEYYNYYDDGQRPFNPIELNHETIIDVSDTGSVSCGGYVYPFIVNDYGFYKDFYDANNNYIGSVSTNEYTLNYFPKVIITCEDGGLDGGGQQLWNVVETWIEEEYLVQPQHEWFYCDEFGNKLEEVQTEIKVWEKNENDEWIEVKQWKINGNRLPIKVECEGECEEDCIPLYDATETYKICLCEPKYNDARDTTFPNLDAEDWPFFED